MSLCERDSANTDFELLYGSQFLTNGIQNDKHKLGQLTKWMRISCLELKLYILGKARQKTLKCASDKQSKLNDVI